MMRPLLLTAMLLVPLAATAPVGTAEALGTYCEATGQARASCEFLCQPGDFIKIDAWALGAVVAVTVGEVACGTGATACHWEFVAIPASARCKAASLVPTLVAGTGTCLIEGFDDMYVRCWAAP